jgi:short-subunit dehydrogenase
MAPKSVLITGCSSGIGRALALEYAHAGYKVYASARNPEKISDLRSKGVECLKLDVNSDDDIGQLIEVILHQSGKLDLLINNAGFGTMAPLLDIGIDELKQQFDTNLFAIARMTNRFAPLMIKAGSGMIVNIGSVSGILTTPFAGAYCASKAAVHSLSEAYRMELAPFGIKVIIVQPGAIASSFGDNSSQQTEQFISSQSIYYPIVESVRRRAKASQERPSPAESFARSLRHKLEKPKPAFVMRIGNGSFILPLLVRLLPARLLDRILSKPFQLDKLNSPNQNTIKQE